MTQAVFIFTNMLRKLLQDEKPNYIAAIFESKEKTFRHETFAGYKANRLAMPDDLASQLPYIIRLCEAFNIPVINAPGYEADDVIGTLAVKTAEKGLQAVIVSNDKDMCQLVRDPYVIGMRQNSQVAKRKEPVPPIEWCDEAWVEKKFGVPADEGCRFAWAYGRLNRQHPGGTRNRLQGCCPDHPAVWLNRKRTRALGRGKAQDISRITAR